MQFASFGADNPCAWGDMAAVAWCTRGALGRCWRDTGGPFNGKLQPFWVKVSMKLVPGSSKAARLPTGPVPCQLEDERGLVWMG